MISGFCHEVEEYSSHSHFIWLPIVKPTRYTCYLKLFILVKRSTCFGRSFHPSSGVQDCTYSNRHMSNSCCYLLLAVLSSWWWTERPS